MSHAHPTPIRKRRRSAGVGLVTAIFLLVVLSGLGVAMLSISGSQQASSSMDLLGARAYQAARAGVEYGVFQQKQGGVCPGAGAPTSFRLPAGSTLSSFSVTVTCVKVAGPVAAGTAMDRYQIVATACNQASGGGVCPNPSTNLDYAQRVVAVEY